MLCCKLLLTSYRFCFDRIIFISPTFRAQHSTLWNQISPEGVEVHEQLTETLVQKLYDELSAKQNCSCKKTTLLVLDDLGEELKKIEPRLINLLVSNSRHYRLSIINLHQKLTRGILGLTLNTTYTGTFITQLYLASPMNIDFISSQITDTNGYIVYSGRDRPVNNQPFFICPVTEGHGNMCVNSPYNIHDIQMGNGSLSQLDFLICDNNSGRVLKELSHWSMLLEVDCY